MIVNNSRDSRHPLTVLAGVLIVLALSPLTENRVLASQSELIQARPLQGIGARTAALIQGGQSGGEIDGAVVWSSSGGAAKGDVSLIFVVDVLGRDLLADSTGAPFDVDVYAYLLTPSGAMVSFVTNSVTITSGEPMRRVETAGLKFVGRLNGPPAEYSLRVLVQNRQTQRYMLKQRDLSLAYGDPTEATVLPPLAVEPDDNWLVGIQHGLPEDEALALLPVLDTWPTTIPTWNVGEPLGLTVGCSDLGDRWSMEARLSAAGGDGSIETQLDLGQLLETAGGISFYRVSIEAPEASPGEYRLDLSVADPQGERIASETLIVLVTDRPDSVGWTDPAFERTAAPRPAPASVQAELETTGADEISPADETTEFEPEPEGFVGGTDEPFSTAEPVVTMPLAGVGARGAALLLSGQSGGEVEGSVVWSSSGFPEDSDTATVSVFVEVDGGGLLAGAHVLPIPIAIHAYLVHSSGSVVGNISEGLLIDNQNFAVALDEAGLKFVGTIEAEPGLYSFRVLVLNRETNKFFLTRRELDLRRLQGSAPLLQPPLIADRSQTWIGVSPREVEPDEVAASTPGITGSPSAMPIWRADEHLEMVIGVSELGGNRNLSARLFDRLGRLVGNPLLDSGELVETRGELAFYQVTAAPPDVPEGRYQFVIYATDADSGESVSQRTTVLIHNQTDLLAWTDPTAPGRMDAPTMLGQPAEPTAAERDELAMRSAYLEALHKWSRGQPVAARRTLAALEHPMESSVSTAAWRRLITVERIAALEMGKKNRAALPAIALLHRSMYDWYLARRETQLARHSWQIASLIAQLAPEVEGIPETVGFGESILLDLSSRLVRSGEREAALQLLNAATRLAPQSAPALLGLGALHERSGNTGAAADKFAELTKLYPEDSEGKLRLAVNKTRLGKVKEAESIYRDLIGPASPIWVRTLAYQELADLLISERRVEEGLALLRRAATEIPGNQRLRILTAHALDTLQRPREAAAMIEEYGTRTAQQSTSPRYRYSTWPNLDGARVRETLEAVHTRCLPALEEVLR